MQVGRDIELDTERAAAPLRQVEPCAWRRISSLQLAEGLQRLDRRPRERLGKPHWQSAHCEWRGS